MIAKLLTHDLKLETQEEKKNLVTNNRELHPSIVSKLEGPRVCGGEISE